MLKYIEEDTQVTFSEVPDEITLCINISRCQNNCVECHSPYLRKNIGEWLDFKVIDELIKKNEGITCVCFMGEGDDFISILHFAKYIRDIIGLKVALYSGREDVTEEAAWDFFDYIKIGPYKPKFGPLNKKTTNQRMYKNTRANCMESEINGKKRKGWTDITEKFWR